MKSHETARYEQEQGQEPRQEQGQKQEYKEDAIFRLSHSVHSALSKVWNWILGCLFVGPFRLLVSKSPVLNRGL